MTLLKKIENKQAIIGVIGLGYVGLPLALRFCKEEFRVIGFDTDPIKIETIRSGRSYINHKQVMARLMKYSASQ